MKKPQLFCLQVLIVLLLATETLTRKSKNYALIVNSSKFWFNYRQTTNSLLLYHYMREHGIPNENILIMNPDNIACNCRNNDPGSITSIDGKYEPNLFRNVEVDFRKDDVNIPNILGAMRMRYDPRTSMKKRLIFDQDSKILIYINGHGGDNYWKIQDTHAIMHYDFAKAVEELNAKKGYKDMLLISDSCAAYTIFDLVDQPNLIMIGSSSQGEKSYSQGRDALLDMSKADMFTFDTEEFLRKFGDKATVQDLFSSYNAQRLMGTPSMKSTFIKKKPSNIPVKEYFESESSWNPELVNFTNKENPVVKKELDHFTDILKSLDGTKVEKEEISYVKKNPIREVLEQESHNFVRFSI